MTEAAGVRETGVRAFQTFALTSLTLLFVLQGLRLLLGWLFVLASGAVDGSGEPGPSLLVVGVIIGVLLVPALPIARWCGRDGALAIAALTIAGARLVACVPAPWVRGLAAAVIVATAGLYLASAVGYLEQRGVVAGTAAAFVLDQALRVAGWTFDPSLRGGWLPVQIVASAAVVWLVLRRSAAAHFVGVGSLERRAGGLRLRGALAFGMLLFLELCALGNAPAVARWTGLDYESAALLQLGAGAVSLVLLLGLEDPPGASRAGALGFAAFAGGAPALALVLGGVTGALALAVGHAFALLLLGWALAPAGGRREERTFVPGLAGFLILTAAYTASFFPGYTAPWLGGLRVPLYLGATLVLAASLALVPRPPLSPRLARLGTCAALVALLVAAAAVFLTREPAAGPAVATRSDSPADGVRVASYNVHWAVRPDRAFDPPAIARALRATGATLISVQEVPVGLPALYGIDLALWLAWSLGMETRYAPAAGALLGNAFLSTHPVARFGFTRLPTTDPVSGRQLDPRALARIEVRTPAGPLRAVGTRLGPDSGAQRAQIGVLLAALPAEGPVVLLGDLNATVASPTLAALRAVGLRDPFPEDAVARTTAAPDAGPARIDWVLVRGYSASDAAVYDAPGSDHLPVAASIWLHRD